jgi:hypothetical protein
VSTPQGERPERDGDLLRSRRGQVIVIASLALLFLAVRIALVLARDPFFDELFTLWITKRSFAGIVAALRHDSGPPLYYFLIHLLMPRGVLAARLFSLACGAVSLAAILRARWLGNARFTAGLLLALYPPAALFAADARSYALCAMLVTLAVLALHRERRWPAALLFVLAAYSHYYGVLFLPLLVLRSRDGKDRLRGVGPFAAAMAAYLPGFVLARMQPREAMSWLAGSQGAASPLAPLVNLSFAGNYPAALFPSLPPLLVAAALALLLLAVVRSGRFAAGILVPMALAIGLGLAGIQVYFPMRFEAVLAGPLVLWMAGSLDRWKPAPRRLLAGALLTLGVAVLLTGIIDHLRRPLEPHRAAALFAAKAAPPSVPIVAASYCYLEVLSTGALHVVAFPPEQAGHPGWRHRLTPDEARIAARNLPAGPFLLVGERGTPEVAAIREARRLQLLFADGPVVVARAER